MRRSREHDDHEVGRVDASAARLNAGVRRAPRDSPLPPPGALRERLRAALGGARRVTTGRRDRRDHTRATSCRRRSTDASDPSRDVGSECCDHPEWPFAYGNRGCGYGAGDGADRYASRRSSERPNPSRRDWWATNAAWLWCICGAAGPPFTAASRLKGSEKKHGPPRLSSMGPTNAGLGRRDPLTPALFPCGRRGPHVDGSTSPAGGRGLRASRDAG